LWQYALRYASGRGTCIRLQVQNAGSPSLTETPSLIRRALVHDTWCPVIRLVALFSVLPSHAQLLSFLYLSSIFDCCVTRGANTPLGPIIGCVACMSPKSRLAASHLASPATR
jgi:hypothetical protein